MNSEIKKHYKMYKAGKRWIFCGLATLGLVVGLNTVDQHAFADTVTQTSPTTEQTNAKTPKSADADKPTPQVKDNTTEKQATKVQSNSVAVNVTTRSASQTENNKPKDVNNVSKTVAKADVKADSNSKVQLSIENQPTASTTEEPENAKNNFDEKDSVVDQASPETEQNDKATNQVSSDQDVSKKEDSKAKLTSTKDQQNKVDQKKITKSDVKKDAKSSSDNIAEGTFGTSDWILDNDGMLHFKTGEFGVSDVGTYPWKNYTNDILNISFDGRVIANKYSASLFAGLNNLKKIYRLENFDVSDTTDFANIFKGDHSLEHIGDVSHWVTSKTNSVVGMFEGCYNLKELDVSTWDVSNLTNLYNLFDNCKALTKLDVSRWDVSNITSFMQTFGGCYRVTELDLANWNPANVTNMSTMFSGCGAVKLDLSHFDMSNVTDYFGMLNDMSNLRVLILSKNTKIKDADMSDPLGDANKRWIAVAGGTEDTPLGDRSYSSEELMTVYNGDMADTYVIDPYETVTDSKDVTQTIHYVNQNGDSVLPDHTQVRHYNREGKNNSNTGETTWGTWTIADGENAVFDAVESPTIPGYVPDMSIVSRQPIDDAIIEMGGQEVTVTYNPIELKGSVTYWDDDENKVVSTDNLNGHFDEDGYFIITVPSGYEIDPENNPNGYTDGQTVHFTWSTTEGANDFTINLRHKHEAVDPTDPEANRTVTQTIRYVDQNGDTIAPNHTASRHYTRTGDKDLVTGKITWGTWNIANGENAYFDAVKSPDIQGYAPDMPMISKQPIDEAMIEMGGQEITVTYNPIELKGSVTYWDDDENKLVSTDNLNGHFDEDGYFTITVPSGYEINPENNPNGYTDGQTVHFTWSTTEGANDFTINLRHKHEAVDPSDPEASRTVTQTIHYVDQNGNPIAPDHTASRHYTRTGDKDLVTGQITWSAWTIADGENGAFDAVESPDIPGYTPDMPMISRQPIDDAMIELGGQDITVTYSPVELKGSVTYWDDEENKVVSTSKLDKSANKDADFKIAVPSNYEIDPKNNPKGYVDGQTVHFTWSAKKGANDFTINLKPKLS
ncbi:mucin-binding protein [Pediococcus acidilactici]|uniref:mucin-binding protein n=2 Tax=Pediococcus acidilactici TaxID=1254 RepID=UPI00189BA5E2|nr:BspA family leucine-rich repeat surface protein [Pediococcus acidilactici]MDB8870329.1 BspA family leucine-rich repeat surface protein [Pediococcus acidilactici]MDB8878040.1 BspA family leucine-rich repeat surface protein [Pediococcus acidilactici]